MSDTAGALQHPWPNLRMQRDGVSLGMWIFLASEVLFFGGLFIGYAVYRSFNEDAFRIAGAHAQLVYGSINTVLLLTSSLAMTVALRAATVNMRSLTLFCLAATAALGAAFLLCKGLEYREDLKEHLFPGPHFPLSPPATQLFWGFYWIMTGIHAVHLSGGIAAVLTIFFLFKRRVLAVQGSTMEGLAIYWHFVDSVWLVLFPLLYLAGRA